MREVQLVGPAYADETLTFSAQDTANWIPVPDESGQARSPIQLRGLPGLVVLGSNGDLVVTDTPEWLCGLTPAPQEAFRSPDGVTFPGDMVGDAGPSLAQPSRSIRCFNGTCYALTSDVVTMSTDKGDTWQTVEVTGIPNLTDLACDSINVYAISTLRRYVYRSSGGAFVQSATQVNGSAIFSIAANDDAVSVWDGVELYVSTDGGDVFSSVYSSPPAVFGDGGGIAIGGGYVIAAVPYIFVTGGLRIVRHQIGGTTTTQNIAISTNLSGADVRKVAYCGGGRFIVVTCDTNTATGAQVFQSSDFGSTWTETTPAGFSPNTVVEVNASESSAIISYFNSVPTSGSYITTTDAGITFSPPVAVSGATIQTASPIGGITSTGGGGIVISPLAVYGDAFDATEGDAYSYTFTAYGGTAPYTYSVFSGLLPLGLALNASTGVISGTLSKAGAYAFTVEVTDSNGAKASVFDSVTVAAPAGGGGPSPTLQPAVLNNPGFESGNIGWTVNTARRIELGGSPVSPGYVITNSPGRTGAWLMRWTGSPAGIQDTAFNTKVANTAPGYTYSGSAWIRCTSHSGGGASIQAGVLMERFADAACTISTGSTVSQFVTYLSANPTWTQLTTFAPSGGYMRLSLIVTQGINIPVDAVIEFDDATWTVEEIV